MWGTLYLPQYSLTHFTWERAGIHPSKPADAEPTPWPEVYVRRFYQALTSTIQLPCPDFSLPSSESELWLSWRPGTQVRRDSPTRPPASWGTEARPAKFGNPLNFLTGSTILHLPDKVWQLRSTAIITNKVRVQYTLCLRDIFLSLIMHNYHTKRGKLPKTFDCHRRCA